MMISGNDLYEYFYCPREVYFMKTLKLPTQKKKMRLGREEQLKELKRLGERKEVFGIPRSEIENIEFNKYLENNEIGLCGVLDLLLKLNGGEFIPVDIKYTSYPFADPGRVKQIIAYSILVDRVYGVYTRRGLLYYPEQNKQDMIHITSEDKEFLLKDLEKIRKIITSEKIPRKTSSKKCNYCGYLKICGDYSG